MKIFLALISLVVCSSAFAANTTKAYDLKFELSVNGKHLSSPRLVASAGEKASITQETPDGKVFIEVVTTEDGSMKKDGILMKFIVGKINADGTRTVMASPQILTLENSEASITQSQVDGTPMVAIKVIPKRVAL